MPSNGFITCNLTHDHDRNSLFRELGITHSTSNSIKCYVPVGENPNITTDYGARDLPYAVHWSMDRNLLQSTGVHVQVEVDGCQKGQPRCYEQIEPEVLVPPSTINGMDDGLWVVPDGSRRRPWVMGEIKTTHPHSALSDKYILDRVGSVTVTFSKARVVPTSHVVPLVPVFNGGAPLPERMRSKLSHWTKLGYIEKHIPAAELGLVAEELGEKIASFTFYYRSEELLGDLMPQAVGAGNGVSMPASPDIRFSFPTSNEDVTLETLTAQSTEPPGSPKSDGRLSPIKLGRPATGFRRALSSVHHPRHSFDGTQLGERISEKAEGAKKLTKAGSKRVRAVSLRVAKRYSLLGNKSEEKVLQKEGLVTGERDISNLENSNEEDLGLDTIEGLKREVLRLRLEVKSLKKHLNI